MFKVNRSENRLVRLEERRFSDLNLHEREHLQEWLVRTPDALGEDLLIIQKEFDGFKDTRERLDILALDKEGRLVVVENKRFRLAMSYGRSSSTPAHRPIRTTKCDRS